VSKKRFTSGYEACLVDKFSSKKRSEIMAKVRSQGNASTEIKALQILKKRRHYWLASPFANVWTPGLCFSKCPRRPVH